jgi:hypothetical protein
LEVRLNHIAFYSFVWIMKKLSAFRGYPLDRASQ